MRRLMTVAYLLALVLVMACSAPAREVETVIPTPPPIFELTFMPTSTPSPTATPAPTATTSPTATPRPTATPNPTATPIPPEVIPEYAAQVELKDASGELYSRGAAFLVDRERGLLATNAHIVYELLEKQSFSMRVLIGGAWYEAYAKDEWVNWWADVAIIGLKHANTESLPQAAHLGEGPQEGAEILVSGYLFEGEGEDTRDTHPSPYSTSSVVLGVGAPWIVSYNSWVERALMLDSFIARMLEEGSETFQIPNDLKQLYYNNYILIQQKENEYDQRYRTGTSGMPIVNEEGSVVAIMSAYLDAGYGTGGYLALVVPVEGVKELLLKVKEFLSETNDTPK